MSSFALNVAILALGTLLGAGLDRFYLWIRGKSKPSFSFETGEAARQTLLRAQNIFSEAQKREGYLSYPWKVREELLYEDALQISLNTASSAIGNKELANSILQVSEMLKNIYENPYISYPMIIILGEAETSPERKHRIEGERIASIQMSAATKGIEACKVANEKLNKISRNI